MRWMENKEAHAFIERWGSCTDEQLREAARLETVDRLLGIALEHLQTSELGRLGESLIESTLPRIIREHKEMSAKLERIRKEVG